MNAIEIVNLFVETMNDLWEECYSAVDRAAYHAEVQRVATEFLYSRLTGATPGDLDSLYSSAEQLVDRSVCGAAL